MTEAHCRSQIKPYWVSPVQPVLRNGGASSLPWCARQWPDTREWLSAKGCLGNAPSSSVCWSEEFASVITEKQEPRSHLGLHLQKQMKGPVTADSCWFWFIAMLSLSL